MSKSIQAAAASMIRKQLKANGIKAKVRSSSASMMTAVDVDVFDMMPATVKKIKEYVSQFQYGHFDGMQDMYEYSNRNKDIPQVKYASVNVEYSDELLQDAWDYTRNYYGWNDVPSKYNGANLANDLGRYFYNVLSGQNGNFWASRKPRIRKSS